MNNIFKLKFNTWVHRTPLYFFHPLNASNTNLQHNVNNVYHCIFQEPSVKSSDILIYIEIAILFVFV